MGLYKGATLTQDVREFLDYMVMSIVEGDSDIETAYNDAQTIVGYNVGDITDEMADYLESEVENEIALNEWDGYVTTTAM